MGNLVRFTCSQLVGTGKQGVLSKDKNGYYEIVVGGLNVFNSVGQYYVYEEAKELFQESSQFMRRVKRGVLAGETGHPKWLPGMSEDQYANRLLSIYEDNICCHHKEISLDFDRVKDEAGRPVIAIISKLKPAGPGGPALAQSLENADENVCFSIRAFTDDFQERGRGLTKRILRTIVTWDRVLEPGLALAEKWKSPGLEDLVDTTFSRGQMTRAIQAQQRVGVAQESQLLTARELFTSMGWEVPKDAAPAWTKW